MKEVPHWTEWKLNRVDCTREKKKGKKGTELDGMENLTYQRSRQDLDKIAEPEKRKQEKRGTELGGVENFTYQGSRQDLDKIAEEFNDVGFEPGADGMR